MNELFDSTLKLLVLLVAVCIAIRLAYDAVRPALPVIGILIVIVVVVRVIAWYRDRW
jgi:hypothetical protein